MRNYCDLLSTIRVATETEIFEIIKLRVVVKRMKSRNKMKLYIGSYVLHIGWCRSWYVGLSL